MARERYLVGVSEEELRPDPKPEGPKTPRGKLENFWYHYKWHTIAAAFAAVVLFVLIRQMVTRDDPDYMIVMATQNYVMDTAADQLEAVLESHGRDIDGDGKVEVSIEALSFAGDSQMAGAYQTKFITHMAAGDIMFYIMDKQSYEEKIAPRLTGDFEFFTPLEVDVSGLDTKGLYWNWKDSVLRADKVFTGMPEDLYFGVRNATGRSKDRVALQAQCLELLRAMLKDTKLTATTAPTSSTTTTATATAAATSATAHS